MVQIVPVSVKKVSQVQVDNEREIIGLSTMFRGNIITERF